MNSQQSNGKSNGQVWINTGTWLLDEVISSGIQEGKLNLIVGKSRQTGKSYYTQEIYMRQVRYYMMSIRKQKIKKIIDLI